MRRCVVKSIRDIGNVPTRTEELERYVRGIFHDRQDPLHNYPSLSALIKSIDDDSFLVIDRCAKDELNRSTSSKRNCIYVTNLRRGYSRWPG
jgi:hypothetical protein